MADVLLETSLIYSLLCRRKPSVHVSAVLTRQNRDDYGHLEMVGRLKFGLAQDQTGHSSGFRKLTMCLVDCLLISSFGP